MSGKDEAIATQLNNALSVKKIWSGIMINVKESPFNAVGDGVVDDTVAIQAAIDYAISIGKEEIVFPAGTYIYGVLTNTAGMTFIGDGVTLTGTTPITLTSIASIAELRTDLTALEAEFAKQSIVYIILTAAVGDGVADDTTAIKTPAELGGLIVFPKGKTYKITDSINVPANTEINLNGSTINFVLSTTIPGFWVKGDNVKIHNGTINVVGSTMGGNGHSLNCITAGSQSDGVGYKNLVFTDLTVSTNRNDAGTSIGIMGECSNVLIENIYAPDNADCRNIIGCEWGGTIAGTGHPHNIRIKNIKCGRLTYPSSGASGFGYAVWASGAFDIAVENISVIEGYGIMMVTAGDKSREFAPIEYKERVGTGISLKNASISECFGYGVRAIGKGGDSAILSDESVLIENLTVTAKVGAPGNVFGFETEYSTGVKLNGFKFDGCYAGYTTGNDAVRPEITNGQILNSKIFGMGLGSGGGACINPIVRNVHFQGNNSLGGLSTGTAALTLTNAIKPVVEHCTFGKAGVTETQKFSIACATTTTVDPRLNNNHTYNISADAGAGSISIPAGVDAYGINNTVEAGITNVVAGRIFIKHPNGTREFWGSTTPTTGTFIVGDTMHYITPTAGGFEGVVCVTAGTPGTWKTFGAITA